MCQTKLSMTSRDGYHILATAHDLSSVSTQIRCDIRSAFLLNPSGEPLEMTRSIKPLQMHLVLPIHDELIDIHASCGVTGFRQLSANEVALTLRFTEFMNQCDDQLRYYIDTRLASEIFGDEKSRIQPRSLPLNRLQRLLSVLQHEDKLTPSF